MKTLLKQALDALQASFELVGYDFSSAAMSRDGSHKAKKRMTEAGDRLVAHGKAMDDLKAELAKPDQQPVGYVYWNKGHSEGALDNQGLKPGTPLYAAPVDCKWPTCHSQQYQQELATDVADQIIGKPDPDPGTAVFANGVLFAWFAVFDEVAREWCTENHFGEWLAWQANAPVVIPITPGELKRIEADAADMGTRLQEARTSNCSTHPDAPHGFDRSASHSAGEYICECASWQPGEAS